jgi:YegS/Rv2252/BmrU family lipid kinase
MTRRGAVIFNPVSGRGRGARQREIARKLLGDDFEWLPTQRAGHATDLAREAARQFEVVVGCGGDGTVGDVVRGIVQAGDVQPQDRAPITTTLGLLPLGTGNDVARNLGIPLDVYQACDILRSGRTRTIDLGKANGMAFINNAGTGFDAAVMRAMNTSLKFISGPPAFFLAILKTLPTFHPFALTISHDDTAARTFDAMMIAVLNGPVFGGGMRAAPDAQLDDGRLDVIIVRAVSKLRLLPVIAKLQAGGRLEHPAIERFQASRLRLETTPPQPINIDGDVHPAGPLAIDVMSPGIRVLV